MFPLRPPFINFPFNNYYNFRKPAYYRNNIFNPTYSKDMQTPDQFKNFQKKLPNSSSSCNPSDDGSSYSSETNNFNLNQTEQKCSQANTNDNYFFEVFGLKLFFDDILLICLLFFLYEEGVKDQELFISLILLLLS